MSFTPDRPSESAVSVRDLVKRYGSSSALDDVSLDIEFGSIVGLLGPNGAGKSTLLETIAGLRKPTSGTVSVLGVDPRRERRATTSQVSVQPQSANVFGYLSVRETLRLYASFHPVHRDVADTIADVGLTGQSEVLARNLSGGQLRRLLLGVAIVGKPRIVILDEPSAGLDPEARRQLLDLIKSLNADGTSVIFSTHDMTEATQVCDRVIIMASGRVRADGAPTDLLDAGLSDATLHFDVASQTALDKVKTILPIDDSSWTPSGGGFHVSYTTSDPDGALEVLTRDRDVRGRGYRIAKPTLEDLYLSIVRESRDSDERSDAHA